MTTKLMHFIYSCEHICLTLYFKSLGFFVMLKRRISEFSLFPKHVELAMNNIILDYTSEKQSVI